VVLSVAALPKPKGSPLQRLVEVVRAAGVYEMPLRGTIQLSVATGLHAQDLHVGCGVSFEKMRQTYWNVLSSLCGSQPGDEEILADLLRATDTYSLAAERATKLATAFFNKRFTDTAGEDGVCNAHLMVDDSNKGMNLSVLPVVLRHRNGNIVLRGLSSFHALTKAQSASDRLIASIKRDIGARGLTRVLGGTTDAFGAAVGTMTVMLRDADNEAADDADEPLHYACEADASVELDWTAPFRQHRQTTCLMHAFERIMHEPVDGLLQQQGVLNEAATAQIVFLIHHAAKKERDTRDAILLIAAGGSEDRFRRMQKLVKRLLKKFAAARWITRTQACSETVQMVDVPASEPLKS
jgi:hypothetical protein